MTIGELTKKTDIGEHTLRFYEKKGLIQVSRDLRRRRFYTEDDVEWVLFIKKLKDTGMLLKDIQTYACLRYEGEGTMTKRLTILEKHRVFILEERKKWDHYLDNLDVKIGFYKNKLYGKLPQ